MVVGAAARLLRRRAHSLDVHPALRGHGRDLLPVAYPDHSVGYCGEEHDADGRQEEGKDIHRVRAVFGFFAVFRVRVRACARDVPAKANGRRYKTIAKLGH
jgi:hypothetical protein